MSGDHKYERLPEHMRDSARMWVERGQPHPRLLGSFMRAALLHDFMAFFACADDVNAAAARDWAMWLYNEAPSQCHGSEEALENWHACGGFEGVMRAAGRP